VDGNNRIRSTVHAVDENGNKRYINVPGYGARAVMVGVYIPQPIKVACEVCTFLRNDPLATTATVNRFVDIVWDRIKFARYRWQRDSNLDPHHDFLIEIRNHVLYGGRDV
jgi:hypothetical protein